ncbi:hypothetical protein ABBQ32_008167 [Trebouxia sp. C0010 RCD-2024]
MLRALRSVCKRRGVRTGSLVALLVNLIVLLNFLVAYLHTTRTHRVYVLGNRILPEAEANFTLPDPSAVSFYQQWIQRDLQPWRASGITTELVDSYALSGRWHECLGEVLRFQIINGSLWIDHLSERHSGWYPARLGPGALSGKGKIPYAILGLLDVIRHYPGQIPDIDAILHTSDFSCVKATPAGQQPAGPPIFGYNSDPAHEDVPFPDYSYWGHEYTRLRDEHFYYWHGWDLQYKWIRELYANVSLTDRQPQAIWRGRVADDDYPERDALRRAYQKCPGKLSKQGRTEDAALINQQFDVDQISDNCRFRYVVYLESMAWSTNGRHKFSCGSVVISNKMGYYEFFTRELKPGVHFVEVDPNNLCDDLVTKVKYMNQVLDAGATHAPSTQGRQGLGLELTNQRSVSSILTGPSEDDLHPQEIADAGLKFMEDHVQMGDVRLYIKDVLKEYASLQTAKEIKPSWNAVCYTGQLVLDQFAFPYRLDKQVVVQAYPWLTSFGQDLCPASKEGTMPVDGTASVGTPARPASRKLT